MIFKYKNSALTVSCKLGDICRELHDDDSQKFYGNKYFICESISYKLAKYIANKLFIDYAGENSSFVMIKED